MGRKDGMRWRGKLSEGNGHPLVRELFRRMNEDRVVMQEVANRAGLKRTTISDWRYMRMPKLDLFVAAANALGYEVVLREAQE